MVWIQWVSLYLSCLALECISCIIVCAFKIGFIFVLYYITFVINNKKKDIYVVSVSFNDIFLYIYKDVNIDIVVFNLVEGLLLVLGLPPTEMEVRKADRFSLSRNLYPTHLSGCWIHCSSHPHCPLLFWYLIYL